MPPDGTTSVFVFSRLGEIIHIPENLYTATPIVRSDDKTGEESQFSYVDSRNRASQIEMEQAVTSHLRALNALVSSKGHTPLDFEKIASRSKHLSSFL